MTPFNLSIEMVFVGTPNSTEDQFEEFLDEVIVQFEKTGREVNLAARLAEHTADFATTVPAATFEDAAIRYLSDLRTALHAAGCVTRGWPVFRPRDRVVRELQDA